MREDEILDQYSVPEQYEDFFRPTPKFIEIAYTYGGKYFEGVQKGWALPADKEIVYKKSEELYTNMLEQHLDVFEREVGKGKMSKDRFPIRDWKYLSKRDETRFFVKDFYQMFARVVDRSKKTNIDFMVCALNGLGADEYSKILGNVRSRSGFMKLLRGIERVAPAILKDPKFNPLESMVNEGNHEFLREALSDDFMQGLISGGKIKRIEKIEIDGDLIRRLASDYDLEKKTNIVKALKVLSEFNLLEPQLKNVDLNNRNSHLTLSQIEPSDKLSYADVYLFSINNVPLFMNNNQRLVDIFKVMEEKRSYTPPTKSKFSI